MSRVTWVDDNGRTNIHQFLESARQLINRLGPAEALAAQRAGAILIDTRDQADRLAEGLIPGAIHLPLSVLPWRADPDAVLTDPRVNDLNARVLLVCNDGYSSSWAGALLVDLGFTDVSDLVGGYRAWTAAGLPVHLVDTCSTGTIL